MAEHTLIRNEGGRFRNGAGEHMMIACNSTVRTGFAIWAVATVFAVAGAAQGSASIVHVDDHWPLSKASQLLESHYGVPISMEDVSAYEYVGELRELDNFAELQRAHPDIKRLLYPRGVLDVSFPEPADKTTPAGVANILGDLLTQHVRNGNPGQFSLLVTPEALVIVPTARRNSSGTLVPDRSPLEMRISFPEADRDAAQAFEAFCEALTTALGKKAVLWNSPFQQQKVRIGANNEVARDVLVRMIASLRWDEPFSLKVARPMARLSWTFAPLPGTQDYALSLRQVSVVRPGRNGLTTRVPIFRTGPLDMNQPVPRGMPGSIP
jgi:hypothetical protein